MSSSDPVAVRNERARDAIAIRRVIEQAFGQTAEADLVEALRRSGALTVSLVAEIDGEVAGHIAFSPVRIQAQNSSHDALGLAPLAVSPAHNAICHDLSSSRART